MNFNHGTKYYVTVTAYNSVLLHTSASSDGFVFDDDAPLPGVVFNTDRHVDTLYQHSTDTFSVSWHGFQDHFSGLHSYSVAVTDDPFSSKQDFVIVGLRTHHTFRNLRLTHGNTYYGLVKVHDAAGHQSNVSVSVGKLVDATPPVAIHCSTYIEMDRRVLNISSDTMTLIDYNLDANSGYLLEGNVSQISETVILQKGDTPSVLALRPQADGSFHFEHLVKLDAVGSDSISLRISPGGGEATVRLQINQCVSTNTTDSFVRIRQVGTEGFSITMLFEDSESDIYKVLLGVGTTPGGFQVKPLSPVHLSSMAIIDTDVPHNTTLFFTVVVENHAWLRSIFHSQPVVMDKTPPFIVQLPVIRIQDDLRRSTNSSDAIVDVHVHWKVEDDESGVKKCYCTLGN